MTLLVPTNLTGAYAMTHHWMPEGVDDTCLVGLPVCTLSIDEYSGYSSVGACLEPEMNRIRTIESVGQLSARGR